MVSELETLSTVENYILAKCKYIVKLKFVITIFYNYINSVSFLYIYLMTERYLRLYNTVLGLLFEVKRLKELASLAVNS